MNGNAQSSSGKRRSTFLLIAVVLILQLVVWRGTRRLHEITKPIEFVKREVPIDQSKHKESKHEKSKKSKHSTVPSSTSNVSTKTENATPTRECRPLPLSKSPEKVCQHVQEYCPPSGHVDYLHFFYCIGLQVNDFDGSQINQASPTQAPTPVATINKKKNKEITHSIPHRIKALRVFALVIIICWMLFLFSSVGIVASDFFCPNLSTLSARLGLSESTAGVTFLAFGNGSPDVFSTFGAMRTGSGSLAIGELIGAASFIVSVISGSMMLIAPFRVKRYPFLRDVGFFTVAVSLTMAFLLDGKLRVGECFGLIALYLTYAATVIIGSWWQDRQRQKRLHLANIRGEHAVGSPGVTINSENRSQTPSPMIPPMSAIEYEPEEDPFLRWESYQQQSTSGEQLTPGSHSSSRNSPLLTASDAANASSNARLQRFKAGLMARHSLLGAVEFRDVVLSLRNEASSTDRSMEIYQSRDPEAYFPHPHQHLQNHLSPGGGLRKHNRARSLSKSNKVPNSSIRANMKRSKSTVGSSADAGALADVSRPTLERIGEPSGLAVAASAVNDPWRENAHVDDSFLPPPAIPIEEAHSDTELDRQDFDGSRRPILPRLAIRQPTGDFQPRQSDENIKQQSNLIPGHRLTESWTKTILRSLFPTLRHLHDKSWLGIFISIVTAPAILVLRVTLPVVDDEAEKALMGNEKQDRTTSGQIRLEGEESQLLAHDHDNDDDDIHDNVGRGTIDLNNEINSPSIDNPWKTNLDTKAANSRKQLQIASALRHLPDDSSPLMHSSNNGPNSRAESIYSNASCDSHQESQSSTIFLSIIQCALAPAFCVWTISSSAESKHIFAKTLLAFVGGLALSAIVAIGSMQYIRIGRDAYPTNVLSAIGWARVAAGFFVSVLYIMTIVDEVVSILQTLGLILGLSDAILGLTVFAMGNSLGDLVANITIANMGHPVMAISACFAGPLLNLLLGIGISGSWLLSTRHIDDGSAFGLLSHDPGVYHIDFSPTLVVSGFGLLSILIGTLICVPLNGFYLNRTIGTSLICAYAAIMCINICVEIFVDKD